MQRTHNCVLTFMSFSL